MGEQGALLRSMAILCLGSMTNSPSRDTLDSRVVNSSQHSTSEINTCREKHTILFQVWR